MRQQGVGSKLRRPDAARARRFRLIVPRESLGHELATSFLHVDCGAWVGNERDQRVQRDFALVSGNTALLASFTTGAPLVIPQVGSEAERSRIESVLRALAGPQGLDVQVTGAASLGVSSESETTYVLLPDLHLPLVTPLPELDPNLIPDPSKATCPCHGPIVSRILYGTSEDKPKYRAVGGIVSRNPNDWFYLLARSYDSIASDLIRFLDRLARPLARGGVQIVATGRLFDIWDGFECLYASTGAMAILKPRMVPRVRDEDLTGFWMPVLMKTRSLDAIQRLYRVAPAHRVLLDAPLDHCSADPALRPHPAQFRDGHLFAENRPEPIPVCRDEPPTAFLGLREQKARFTPWTNNLGDAYRPPMYAAAALEYVKSRYDVYVMSHTQRPALTIVELLADDFPLR